MRTLILLITAACFSLTLDGFSEPAPTAADILDKAKAAAKAEHKNIFIRFSASWCGWCKRMDAFLAAPEIKPVLERHLVIVKLIVHESEPNKGLENAGADDWLAKVDGQEAGLPFFAFLDATGGLLVNSKKAGKDNVGHPFEPAEIEWFMAGLKKAAPKLTPAETDTVESWLKAQKR